MTKKTAERILEIKAEISHHERKLKRIELQKNYHQFKMTEGISELEKLMKKA